MLLFGEYDLLDRINYLQNIMSKEEVLVVACNYHTAKLLEQDGYDRDYFEYDDELEDFVFDVARYNLETNDCYD